MLDESEIWLKADSESDPVWDAEGCEKFRITFKDGKVDTMNYRRAPQDVYDDPDEMRRWAALARRSGRGGAAKKRPRTPSSRRKPGPRTDRHGGSPRGPGFRRDDDYRTARINGAISGLSSIDGRNRGSTRLRDACS